MSDETPEEREYAVIVEETTVYVISQIGTSREDAIANATASCELSDRFDAQHVEVAHYAVLPATDRRYEWYGSTIDDIERRYAVVTPDGVFACHSRRDALQRARSYQLDSGQKAEVIEWPGDFDSHAANMSEHKGVIR